VTARDALLAQIVNNGGMRGLRAALQAAAHANARRGKSEAASAEEAYGRGVLKSKLQWRGMFILMAVASASLVTLNGCASQQPRRKRAIPGKAPVYPADSHMVFNPDWSGLPVVDVPRADWPVAYGAQVGREETAFRERIIDRPAQFNGQRDQYTRRFSSTRHGRIHR